MQQAITNMGTLESEIQSQDSLLNQCLLVMEDVLLVFQQDPSRLSQNLVQTGHLVDFVSFSTYIIDENHWACLNLKALVELVLKNSFHFFVRNKWVGQVYTGLKKRDPV